MKNKQISPWSFYNEQASTLPLITDENASNKNNPKSVQKRKKRQASLCRIQPRKSLIEDRAVLKKTQLQAALHNLQQFADIDHSFESTDQSLIGKYKDSSHDYLGLLTEKNQLERICENDVILRLIWSELRKERDNQTFLELQREEYSQRHKESTKQTQSLKFPKIQKKNRSFQIVNYRFMEQKDKKSIQYNHQLLQQLLNYKIKLITSHKMKALGFSKQLVPRSLSHQSSVFHQ